MNFCQQLQEILLPHLPTADIIHTDDVPIEVLSKWNDEVEDLLFASPEEQKRRLNEHGDEAKTPDDGQEEVQKENIDKLVLSLRDGIVFRLLALLNLSSNDNNASMEDKLKLLADRINTENDIDNQELAGIDQDNKCWAELEYLFRTSSNFLRWYLQIYLQYKPLIYPMSSSPFQSSSMLSIILSLLEFNSKNDTQNNNGQPTDQSHQLLPPSQRFARYASLLLFYATFSPLSPNDETMQSTHELLVNELHFLPRALKLLTYLPNTSAALALSLIRNVHNLLASFSGSLSVVQQTGFPFDGEMAKAPWSPKPDDNTDGLITYPSIFRDVLIWSLTTPTLPPFPGPKDDRRPDLVVEILGIIFAMGGGEVTRALRHPCPNPALSQLVITSLQQFDSNDPRTYQVKLSTITILTDASPSFGTFLVEKNAVKDLMEILEKQMDAVLDATQVDDAAVSALVPSLAVLYKLSAGNPTFREVTKHSIFPPSQEDLFWRLAQAQLGQRGTQQIATNNGQNSVVPAATNMQALDAPRGTLRYKLIRLMTWTESHIKRYSCELLWALCEEDPKEFVLRTGMGNAIAFLRNRPMDRIG